MSRPGWGAVRVAALLTVVGVAAASAPGAVVPPAGNQAAIAFFKQEVGYYSQLRGAKIVETGYFFGISSGHGSVKFLWAAPPPAGYQPQTATIYAQLSSGRFAAYLAVLASPGLLPVRVLMSNGAVFLSSGKCWKKATAGASPLGTGDRFLLNGGGARFQPLRTQGKSTAVIFSYPWVANAQALETDTFGPGTMPTLHTTIRVTGAQKLAITRTVTPLRSPPPLPIPSPPAPPTPKPLCT